MIAVYILLALILGYVLFVFVCGLFVDPKREYMSHSRFFRWVLNHATAVGLWLVRVRIHVTGMEKLPTDRPVLFVSNHRSNYDPIITWSALRKWNISFVTKPGNFKVPFYGRLVRRCCFLGIDRDNPRSSLLTIRKAAELLQKGEVNVGIYPEGTRNKSCRGLLEFHNGVFKIAQIADAAIAVLTVTGTEQIHKNTPFRRSHVYLNVVQVLEPEGRTSEIGAKVRKLMEEDLNIEKSEVTL